MGAFGAFLKVGAIFEPHENWNGTKDPVPRTIARLNIQHFRKLLAQETDDAKRRVLLGLLAEEEAKLAALENDPPKERA